MNQIKIGRFIAECRKNVSLTQMQLAEKLGITDKAISKWERGLSMPDTAIMLELCDILGISVNELLSGEKFMTVLSKERSRTYHGFKPYKPGSESCIDYIAVSSSFSSDFEVKDSYVVEDTVTSDHFPVVTAVLQKRKQ